MEQNTVLATRTQQTSSLSLAELHPTMQLACRNAARMDSIATIVGNPEVPSIGKLQRAVGDNDLEKVFRYLLAKMREEMHIDNGFTNDNIRNIARRLRTDDNIRWWLNVADIRLLCQKITRGEYGKFYGHLSEQEFYDCMTKYCNERCELHRVANDKTVDSGEPAVLEEVGYKMDAHGNLIVPEKLQGVAKKKPMRYIYNEKCEIVGENPIYWGKVRQGKSREEMEKINKSNKVMELTRALLKANPTLGYLKAVELAAEEVEKEEKEEPAAGTQTKLF